MVRPGGGASRELAPLLGAKLLPPAPGPFHLLRPRLHERLHAGLEGRATIVLAGPGYGKSSLVSGFVRDLGMDSVWVTLDPADRDPRTLLRYLVAGLKEHAADFGERIDDLLREPRPSSDEVERLVDILVSDAEETLDGRLVVVLDEIHHLESSPLCARVLRRLLAYLPGTLHLLLVGRSLPEIGTKSLAAEGSVNVVKGDELLFTLDETRTLLLESFGLRMAPETVAKVHARTRGWVTALQLLRQTARLGPGQADLPEDVFTRTESDIFDYFSEEVFAGESEPVQAFLLGASVPDFIDPDIGAEVLEGQDVRGMLDRLLKRKLFLSPLESQSEYYAFDPLFRDFLRRKLRAERGADGRRELDRLYGRAFARRGAFPEALAHWIAAEETQGIADLLAKHGHALLRGGVLDTVLEAAHFIAARGVRAAVVDDLLGEASRLAGDYGAAAGFFERALGAAGPEGLELTGTARAGTLQGLAYSLLKKGETARAAVMAEKALEEAGGTDFSLLARILNTLAVIRYRENRLEEALDQWQEALHRARQADDHHLVLMMAHNLGLPHAVIGDFKRASDYFQVLTGPDNPRVGPQEGAAYLNLARIATLSGDHVRSASLLGDAREIARKWRLQSLAADVLEEEGNLLRETGEFAEAAARYAKARAMFTELGHQDVVLNIEEECAVLAARRGDHEEAERLGASVVESWRAQNADDGIASSLLALGEIRIRAGRAAEAEPCLVESASRFSALGRRYQECMSRLWLALARFRSGRADAADEEALAALALSARYDYRAGVLRVAGLDAKFLAMLGSLEGAPAYLRTTPPADDAVPARSAGLAQGADLTVRLFGPVEVYRDAERKIPESAWKIRRALQMFCYLSFSRNHRASKDRLVDALWGNARPSVIEKNFHPTISFLRRALNHGHKVSKNFLLFERGAYLLNPEYRYEIDSETFEERVRSGRVKAAQGDVPGALSDFSDAVALYGGPFLEEDYSEWTEAPRTHFEGLYVTALSEAANLHLRRDEYEPAIAYLERLVAHDPIDEDVSRRLMRALGSMGNRAGIEKEHRRLQTALKEDLDTPPLPETRRAYEESLAAASGRAAVERTAARPPAPQSARRVRGRDAR